MWIVMTSSAKMPNNCWGTYRRVALVQLTQEYISHNYIPKMISKRARGVLRVINLGNHNVGKTSRCAYARAIVEAERHARELNNSHPIAHGDMLMSWGGSA